MSYDKDFKKPKVTMESPKFIPKLRFVTKEELKENDLRFGFWSEDRNKLNPSGTHQKELINYLKNNRLFHTFIVGETMEGKGVYGENMAEYIYKNHLEKKEKVVLIDISGKNYEGAFWVKNYKCIIVYPQLLKPKKPNQNPNVEEIKLSKKNTWPKLIRKASREKKILILLCYDPLEHSYLRAEGKLFQVLSDDLSLINIKKIALLREISFIVYKQGLTKVSNDRGVLDTKRWFLKLVRTGRHSNSQLITDAQRMKDIDDNLGDNVALKVIKRTNTYVGNYPKYVQDKIKKLEKNQAVLEFRGKLFTCTIRYNEWHKKEDDKIQDLKIFPTPIDLSNFNKLKENNYINWISENWTNYYNRLIIARRRHIQNEDDTRLCSFELADLLAIEGEFNLMRTPKIDNFKLVYGEVKFRDSIKHPRIEKGDVLKTIQDLALKRIVWSIKKKCYFWTIDNNITKTLNWVIGTPAKKPAKKTPAKKTPGKKPAKKKPVVKEIKIPTKVIMITSNGITKGAKALMDKHHIYYEILKLPNDFYT